MMIDGSAFGCHGMNMQTDERTMQTALLGLSTDELRALALEEGEPAYRGGQLARWLHQHEARTFEEMANLPEALSVGPDNTCQVGRDQTVLCQRNKDGTAKLLLEMDDGAVVETVGLRHIRTV